MNIIQDENTIIYTIHENGKTVKQIMIDNLKFSKRLSKKLEINNKLFINNKKVKLNKKTHEKDELLIIFVEEEDEYEAVDIPIDILYEDTDLLIVNKPPFIVVHPTKSHFDNTIANGVAYYFKQKGLKKKVRLVNRLDMNTSGIVIIAKNPYAHNQISKQMRENKVAKYYYALVKGNVLKDKDTINAPIARLSDDFVRVVHPSGKECITHYEVIKRLINTTYVKLKLDTGRTHQIRVHMKYIGNPVLGDVLYDEPSEHIDRQALHCGNMSFDHPRTGVKIDINAPIPDDMLSLLEI